MPTPTTNYGLEKPLVNDAQDQDLWGGYLNEDMDDIDGLMATAIKFVKSNQTANFSVTSPTTGSTATGDSKKLFRCDTTSASLTASLPAASAAGNGFTVAFKKMDVTAHTVTIDPAGADTIDGAASLVLANQYSWAVIVSDGVSAWDLISGATSTAGLAPLASPAFTGTPTAPTPAVGATTLQIVNAAYVNPDSNIAASGHRKNPDGSIEQWGTFTTNSSGYTTLSFPETFATALYSITGNYSGNDASNFSINFDMASATTSGIPAAAVATDASYRTANITFRAIGK